MPRILITFLVFISALQVSPSFGQDINAFGMPALTSAISANGETTYSLSLQILLLMTRYRTPLACFGNDGFHSIIIVLSILRCWEHNRRHQIKYLCTALFLSFYIMSPIFEVLYVGTIILTQMEIFLLRQLCRKDYRLKRIYGF